MSGSTEVVAMFTAFFGSVMLRRLMTSILANKTMWMNLFAIGTSTSQHGTQVEIVHLQPSILRLVCLTLWKIPRQSLPKCLTAFNATPNVLQDIVYRKRRTQTRHSVASNFHLQPVMNPLSNVWTARTIPNLLQGAMTTSSTLTMSPSFWVGGQIEISDRFSTEKLLLLMLPNMPAREKQNHILTMTFFNLLLNT